MSPTEHPKNGTPAVGPCYFCNRLPKEGEKYGTGPEDWDFSEICPECWEEVTQ